MSYSVDKNNVFVVSSQYDTIDGLIKVLGADKNIMVVFSDDCDGVLNCVTQPCKLCGLVRGLEDEKKIRMIDDMSSKYDYVLVHVSVLYSKEQLR